MIYSIKLWRTFNVWVALAAITMVPPIPGSHSPSRAGALRFAET